MPAGICGAVVTQWVFVTLADRVQFRARRERLVGPGQIECHVADMTATVAADVPLEVAQTRLGEFDQWIPIDGDQSLAIGRLVEMNSSGPLRLGYGAWRDLLLGCQFETSDGQLITAGGRTMKNVAGYDLTKLMVGQRGMFGSLMNITCRTYKRPEAALVAEFAPSDRWLGEILTTPLRPRYAILTADTLVCGWLDDERAIELLQRLASERHPRNLQRRSPGQEMRVRAKLWSASGSHFRASVGPARILEFAGAAKVRDWVADAGFGIVIGPYADGDEARIEKAAVEAGGSVTFFAEDQPPRWRQNAAESMVLERLKKAFVPAG
jgi:hypothetical protein